MSQIAVHPQVAESLRASRPVVALETAVLTHGLPREGVVVAADLMTGDAVVDGQLRAWDSSVPANIAVAKAAAHVVRECGASPATIGVIDGQLVIGLNDDQLQGLAAERNAIKVSSAGLASAMLQGANAGTTVSATLVACRLAAEAAGGAIRFFATGGIGGVHRGWAQHPDISADLLELSRSQVCVVSAGCKSLLDVPATRELLESLCVPVIGHQCDALPWFYAAPSETCAVTMRVDTPQQAAMMCQTHWQSLRSDSAVLLCQSPPQHVLIDAAEIERATAAAESLARTRGLSGTERTPFVLSQVASATGGRTLLANIVLLLGNAALAARTAVAWYQNRG